ncbi:retinol dehydrogenase 8-like [Acanthaster planci]|uniref:Retinol dehydrogenase 8-like n=1 Tax=Acanthaster planci TaxID=133434 RepID=A0A8B7YFH6_ACAPL|nr:retinol dehydrogenase 8-like [Acanthaster planci]
MAPKVVLITGCSCGLGLAEAVLLSTRFKHDFKVYATVLKLSDKGDLEAAAGDAINKNLFIREVDVTKTETIKALVDEIIRDNGRIDVVVNNAAVNGIDDPFFAKPLGSLDQAQAMMDVNFWGPAQVIKAVLPFMQEQKSGLIINTTSESGKTESPFIGLYAATKCALEGLSESLALVLRKAYNIRVVILEPGTFTSPMVVYSLSPEFQPEFLTTKWEESAKGMFSEFWHRDMRRLMMENQAPEEVARVVEEIILCDEPHLRYQSGPIITQRLARKLRDPTGDSAFKAFQSME